MVTEQMNRAEWLEHIAERCVETLRELQQKEGQLSDTEWELADLCGGYIHAYNVIKDHHLIDPLMVPVSRTIH
jgi:hypothetical protein